MTDKPRKVLITGANGFLGSYITRKLTASGRYELTCLVRQNGDLSLISDLKKDLDIVRGDIRDVSLMYDTVKGMDCIIHAAAEVSFTSGRKSLLSSAMDGTANLVNAALEANTPKFVHISSVAAIGRRKPVEEISERQMFAHSQYDTDYGLAKFLAEQEVWRANAEGLNTTILNPSMILGAGNWEKTSLRVISEIYGGLKFFPAGVTGWVDVRDVADAVIRAMAPDQNGKRYIISSQNLPYGEVFGLIADHLGVKKPGAAISRNLFIPVLVYDKLRSLFAGRKPLLSMATLRSTSAESYYQNTASVSDLGMNYIPVRNTIADTCLLFKQSFAAGQKYALFT